MPGEGNLVKIGSEHAGMSDPFASEGRHDSDLDAINGELRSVVQIFQDLESITPVDIFARSVRTQAIYPLLSKKSSSKNAGPAKASPRSKRASRRPSLFGVFAKKPIDDFSSSDSSSGHGFASKISNTEPKNTKSLTSRRGTGFSPPHFQQESEKDMTPEELNAKSKTIPKNRTIMSAKRNGLIDKISKTQQKNSMSLPIRPGPNLADSLQSQSNQTSVTDETSQSRSMPTDQSDKDVEGQIADASSSNRPQKHLPRNPQIGSRRPSSMPRTERASAEDKRQSVVKKHLHGNSMKVPSLRSKPGAPKKHPPLKNSLQISDADPAKAPRKHLPRNSTMLPSSRVIKKHSPRNSMVAGHITVDSAVMVTAAIEYNDEKSSGEASEKVKKKKSTKEKTTKKKKKESRIADSDLKAESSKKKKGKKKKKKNDDTIESASSG